MGHGTPDWWGAEPTETIFQVQDLGELAARLGSIDTFDRRGNVLYLEDFEGGLGGWSIATSGTGAGGVLSAQTKRSGAYSVKLIGGSTAGYYAELYRIFPYPSLSKFGLEVSFTIEADIDMVDFEFHIYDGTDDYLASIRYDQALSKLQYLNSIRVWTDLITGLSLITDPGCFHTLKLAVDGENLEYFYILIDDQEASLAGQGMPATASPASPAMSIAIYAYSNSGVNGKIYVDDLILTHNEP